MCLLPYNDASPESIETFAKGLIGKTFKQILLESKDKDYVVVDSNINYDSASMKGNLGNLLEEKYFGYKANSDQEADFPKCGVELKATCFETKKNGKLSAGERLVLTMISYEEEVEEDFYKSHVWDKCRLILLIYYERNKALQSNLLYKIHFANLISPAKNDLPIIIDDYNKIIGKIKNGKAETISESDTLYLGACTKGATSAKSLRPQFYGDHSLAPKRAFCFKRQYMDYILNTYIIPDKTTYEPLIQDISELENKSFEDIIVDRIAKYYGTSDEELCSIFDREYNNNKAQWVDLTYRMLGIKGNHAEEFQKANIVVKVIRFEEDFSMNESISLPPFKFMDLVEETWEESEVYNYFSETKFFFVVFKRSGERYYLYKCKFWNMPYLDFHDVQMGWLKIQHRIKNGVEFDIKTLSSGKVVVSNNLPKKKDNRIIHIRPHATKGAYLIRHVFEPDFELGNIERDANMLPQLDYMTTQSFWINNDYIVDEIMKD